MNKFGRGGQFGRIVCRLGLGAACLALANCANGNVASRVGADPDVSAKVAVEDRPSVQPAPKRKTAARPAASPGSSAGINYSAIGTASWYGADFHGRRTAGGESYDMNSLTAAHPTLPLQCRVRVTNLANHRSLVLRVNDRGPYVGHRVIDVSAKSAKLLGFYDHGLAKVKVEYIGRARAPAPAEQVTSSAAPL